MVLSDSGGFLRLSAPLCDLMFLVPIFQCIRLPPLVVREMDYKGKQVLAEVPRSGPLAPSFRDTGVIQVETTLLEPDRKYTRISGWAKLQERAWTELRNVVHLNGLPYGQSIMMPGGLISTASDFVDLSFDTGPLELSQEAISTFSALKKTMGAICSLPKTSFQNNIPEL